MESIDNKKYNKNIHSERNFWYNNLINKPF